MSDIGKLGFPTRFHFSESNAIMNAVGNAQSHPDVQAVRNKINEDTRFQALSGKMVSHGDTGGTVDDFHLSYWWAWRANEVGHEVANAELERFMAADELESLVCVWLFGDFVAEKTPVIDGVEFWPSAQMPFSWEKIEFSNHKSSSLGHIMPAPQAALVQKVCRPKTYNFPDDIPKISVGYRLNCLALLLNLLPGVKVSVCCTCSYNTDDQPPGIWTGGASSSPISDVIIGRGQIYKNDENIEISKLLDAYIGRSDDDRASLNIALQRIRNAKGRMSPRDNSSLDLGIALERLLLDNERADQLALSFRLRGALLIGENEQDKIETYNILKEIYETRSKIAHFGSIKRKNRAYGHQKGPDSHMRVAERIARKIVLEGAPDWGKLLLGVKE